MRLKSYKKEEKLATPLMMMRRSGLKVKKALCSGGKFLIKNLSK